MTPATNPTPVAHTLGAFRACEHDDAIAYSATLEAVGPEAVASIVRALRVRSHLSSCDGATPRHSGCFAVLDLVDDQGCWFDNYCIPDLSSFEHIRAALNLRVISSDCEQGCT